MFIPANGVKISENTITPSGLNASYGCKEISTHKSTVSERSRNVVCFAQILVHFHVPSSLSHHPDGRSFALLAFDRAHHERVSRRCFHHRRDRRCSLRMPRESSLPRHRRRRRPDAVRARRSFPSSSFNGDRKIRTNTPHKESAFFESTLGTRFFTEQPARFDPCVALKKVVVSRGQSRSLLFRKKARRCVVSVDKSGKKINRISFPSMYLGFIMLYI